SIPKLLPELVLGFRRLLSHRARKMAVFGSDRLMRHEGDDSWICGGVHYPSSVSVLRANPPSPTEGEGNDCNRLVANRQHKRFAQAIAQHFLLPLWEKVAAK